MHVSGRLGPEAASGIVGVIPMGRHRVAATDELPSDSMKNVKIGDVELRMVARPASSARSLQAIMVQGTTLLRQA